MTFIESVQTCYQKYANFDGTASRSEFWWFSLFSFIAGVILREINLHLYLAFMLATALPTFAVGARRLHDTDRSGWFQLLFLVPLIGAIVLLVFFVQEGRPNRYVVEQAYTG